MTTLAIGRWPGLITPTRSTAQSESGIRVWQMEEDVRLHLLRSYAVRIRAERAFNDLEQVREEASFAGWNGYGAKPLNASAYRNAKLFLAALPSTAPSPEISADPDGDVALDWSFGPQNALSVSINETGRCVFAWMHGLRTYRGTDWLDDGIPVSIANALSQLARETAQTRTIR